MHSVGTTNAFPLKAPLLPLHIPPKSIATNMSFFLELELGLESWKEAMNGLS
jgi:hypothetical protein